MSQPSEFMYRSNKDGSVLVLHRGRTAATLRGQAAAEFLDEVSGCTLEECQHVMARLTGNYKRGNERVAQSHPRNQAG